MGERAQVTVDGHADALAGTVSYVGVTNSASSTGSSATYPVTVQLARRSGSLYDGMGAGVAIDVGTAHRVLAVPISAVHTTGGRHVVTVLASGTPSATRSRSGSSGRPSCR